jgi:hypothetical protein
MENHKMKTIVNVETGEVTERELNAEELAQAAIDQKANDAREAEKAKVETHKAAVLDKLGLTADDLKALGL